MQTIGRYMQVQPETLKKHNQMHARADSCMQVQTDTTRRYQPCPTASTCN
eukprot:m.859411 g.859411  ORF g.859411 m.859411 type:complete len:50 (-) comp23526_c0_seq27:1450-1599(-)